MREPDCDVCVIGGGPAGALAARRLAQMGHRVRLVERTRFPRSQVGESLSPGVRPLLDIAGVRREVAKAHFHAPQETLLCWKESSAWRIPVGARADGLLVERSVFDMLLLNAAREAGAEILQPMKARVERLPDRWLIEAGERSFSASMLLDAAGRKGVLPKRSLPYAARTCAVWGNFRKCAEVTRVEAVRDGWFWAAPVTADRLSLVFFCEPSLVRNRVAEDLLRERLSRSQLLEECTNADLHGSVKVLDATCRFTPENIGNGFVRIGEANYTVDPLSSTGVEKAMQSALWGALAANTVLQDKSSAGRCEHFYRERQAEAIKAHREWSGRFYGEVVRFAGEPFWSRRRVAATVPPSSTEAPAPPPALGESVRLHPRATLLDEPCVNGEFIATRLALRAPQLPRPIVFLDGVEIATLIEQAVQPVRWGDLLMYWERHFSLRRAERVAGWLWSKGVIVRTGVVQQSVTPSR
jgi:flavin-dependent dehydrogenase